MIDQPAAMKLLDFHENFSFGACKRRNENALAAKWGKPMTQARDRLRLAANRLKRGGMGNDP
jgi:hypothetical protein